MEFAGQFCVHTLSRACMSGFGANTSIPVHNRHEKEDTVRQQGKRPEQVVTYNRGRHALVDDSERMGRFRGRRCGWLAPALNRCKVALYGCTPCPQAIGCIFVGGM